VPVAHACARSTRPTPPRGYYGLLGFVETGRRPIDDLGNPFALIRLDRAV